LNSMVMRSMLGSIVQQVRFEYVAGYVPEVSGKPERGYKAQVKLLTKDKGRLSGGSRTVIH
jgi:hypothetical protein